jgi:hypothetical protein
MFCVEELSGLKADQDVIPYLYFGSCGVELDKIKIFFRSRTATRLHICLDSEGSS